MLRYELESIYASNGNADMKRKRTGKEGDVKKALKKWFMEARQKDARVNAP